MVFQDLQIETQRASKSYNVYLGPKLQTRSKNIFVLNAIWNTQAYIFSSVTMTALMTPEERFHGSEIWCSFLNFYFLLDIAVYL